MNDLNHQDESGCLEPRQDQHVTDTDKPQHDPLARTIRPGEITYANDNPLDLF